MPMMHANIRTPERYRFIKGVITHMDKDTVVIVPYGETNKVITKVTGGITEFWNGGFDFSTSGIPAVGRQGTVTTFQDDNGNLLVETLYVDKEQIRGTIRNVESDHFLVQQDHPINHLLSDIVVVTLLENSKMFDDTDVKITDLSSGQKVTVIGKLLGHSHFEAFRIEVRK